MTGGHTFRDQAELLIEDAWRQLFLVKNSFEMLLQQSHPTLPAPRAPERYITKTLVLSCDILPTTDDGLASVILEGFYEHFSATTSRKELRNIVPHDWKKKLITQCDTPRKLCRALARLDAYRDWFQRRTEGLQCAESQVFANQEVYVEKLNARLGGLELAKEANGGKSLMEMLFYASVNPCKEVPLRFDGIERLLAKP